MHGNETWVDQMLSLTERGEAEPHDHRWEAAALLTAGRRVARDPAALDRLEAIASAGIAELARGLATAPVLPEEAHAPHGRGGASESVHAFLHALALAGAAICRCRKELHPAGVCRFSPEADRDVCGDLLVASHKVGTRLLVGA